MATTTTPPESIEPEVDVLEIEAIDPERDMDARKTSYWLIGLAVGLFLSLWLLFQLFVLVLADERRAKINELPPAELETLRAQEQQALQGIEQSIDKYLKQR